MEGRREAVKVKILGREQKCTFEKCTFVPS